MDRYFFAIAPPPPTADAIERLRGRYGHPHHQVEPHFTVKIPFTWAADPQGFLAPVRVACAGAGPFDIALGAPARFREAGVLYLNVTGPGPGHLHRTVLASLEGLVPADPRGHEGPGYTPHLTLAVARFGIDDAGLVRMEQEARETLCGLPPFRVEALRCYRRQHAGQPWQPMVDLPLGGQEKPAIMER